MRPHELDQRCAELKARMLSRTRTSLDAPTPDATVHQRRQPATPVAAAVHVAPPPSEIVDPHRLIARTRKGISREAVKSDGLMYLANSVRLDVCVSRACAARAVWFMDSLLKRMEHEGMGITIEKIGSDQNWATWVQVEGEKIRVRLREIIVRVEKEPSASEKRWRERNPTHYWYRQTDSRPTGKLAFALLSNNREEKKWSDNGGKQLEDRIDQIVTGLRRTAELEKRQRLQREAWHQMYAAEESLRRRAERANQELSKRMEDLKRDVDLWHESERVRAYLTAFRAQIKKWNGPIDADSETVEWLTWADRYADWLDPLNPGAK